VDWAFEGFEELPKHCGGAVAEDGALAAGENGGHEAAVEAQAAVADGVDALVDAVQLSTVYAISYCASAQARHFELPPRRHAMLPRSDPRHLNIGRVAFLTHVGT